MAGRAVAPEFDPEEGEIDPVEEEVVEEDGHGGDLLADDPQDEAEEYAGEDIPAEAAVSEEAPPEAAASSEAPVAPAAGPPAKKGWSGMSLKDRIACLRILHGAGAS